MLTKTDLFELLSVKNVDFQIHDHEPLFTVEDSENLRGEIEGAHTKNLFLKNKKNNFFLFSCDENAKVDLKQFSKSIDAKNLSFANAQYLEEYLGIKPGSVSPFALLNDKNDVAEFYLDEKLYNSQIINYHPLINTTTITIRTSEFINFLLEKNKKVNIFCLDNYSIVKVL